MAGALVHVWDDLGEAPVEPAAPDRVEALVRGRSEQRVCEADAVTVELDHLRLQRRPEGVSSIRDCRGQQLERRLRERRRRGEDVAALRRQRLEPGANELLETVGDR